MERHDGEDVVMYLFRRAQRDPIDNAYNDMNNRKYTKKKGKKGKATKGSMEEVVEAELALDKDAGEVIKRCRGGDKACPSKPSHDELFNAQQASIGR